jgi:predicted dehydrogenase
MAVRIGFAGVGNMGQCAHLRNYAAIADCEVVALAEMHRSKGKAVAQRYGVPKVYGTIAEMLANEQLDGIVASQPFSRHGLLLQELLAAGVPVFTEKPIASSVDTGRRIVSMVEASGTWLMLGYHKRSDPATMYAKGEIERLEETGELGAMTYVRIVMPAGDWIAGGFTDLISGDAADKPDYGALPHDPADPEMDAATCAQYIEFVNYYIHQVNLMRHLLGESYEVTHADPSGVLLVGRSASGLPCTIEMSPYRTTLDWQESALVCFEKGWLRLSLPAPLALHRPGTVEIFRDGGSGTPQTLSPQFPWVHAMRQQALNFLAAIRGEMPPLCGAAEALEDLLVARQYIEKRRAN